MSEGIQHTCITAQNPQPERVSADPLPRYSENRSGHNWVVAPASRDAVDHLIQRHYLHCWPTIVACTLGLREGEEYIGVIVFALPPRETNKRYSVAQSLELARLFIEDSAPKNSETWFIARAIRYIKRRFPKVELLVSYADPSVGHKGTIYKAANWILDGRTDSKRKSPRFDLMAAGKIYTRANRVPAGVETVRVLRVSKYRFIYWLDGLHERRRSLRLAHA